MSEAESIDNYMSEAESMDNYMSEAESMDNYMSEAASMDNYMSEAESMDNYMSEAICPEYTADPGCESKHKYYMIFSLSNVICDSWLQDSSVTAGFKTHL
ncbi:unnamed protein product [Candidula unifasciata]|uniref:Uncharacterized protein n=1 Tax=Candidula unifasciata TaxID=100452 RepID=A0A8S3YVN9_9EUPU|nr:unnamed protein product [Candidula unifasciata]